MIQYRIFTFFSGLFILAGTVLFAQDKKLPQYGWEKEVVGGINLSQAGFDNWVQGG